MAKPSKSNAAKAPTSALLHKQISPRKAAPPDVLSELKAVGERTGAVLGNVYARLASVVLNEFEKLEDLNAQRRSERSKRHASGAATPRLGAAHKPLPPKG